jgi:hypothetical protein
MFFNFSCLNLAYVRRFEVEGVAMVEYNNLTIINFLLKLLGPLHERDLTLLLLAVQASKRVKRRHKSLCADSDNEFLMLWILIEIHTVEII